MKWCFDLIYLCVSHLILCLLHFCITFHSHFHSRFLFRVHCIFCFKFHSTASISAVFSYHQTATKIFFIIHLSFWISFGFLIYRWVEKWKHEVLSGFWDDSCFSFSSSYLIIWHHRILVVGPFFPFARNALHFCFFFFLMHCTIFLFVRVTDKWFKSTNVMCLFFVILLVGRLLYNNLRARFDLYVSL